MTPPLSIIMKVALRKGIQPANFWSGMLWSAGLGAVGKRLEVTPIRLTSPEGGSTLLQKKKEFRLPSGPQSAEP